MTCPLDPVMMYQGVRCCAALKKPWMDCIETDSTKLSASAYMHQCLWHMYCTGSSTCVFAARTNKEMMVEVLYWDEWASYVRQAMIPPVRAFVTEVVLSHCVVSDAGVTEWKDWIRQPITNLTEISEYKSWSSAIKRCSQTGANALLSDSDTENLRILIQSMTSCEAQMTAVLESATGCALDWSLALDAKIETITRTVSEGSQLTETWNTAHTTASELLGLGSAQGSNTVKATAVAVDPQTLSKFKRLHNNRVKDCEATLKPQLQANGWGGRGGKVMPTKWAEWCLAADALTALRQDQQSEQVVAGLMQAEPVVASASREGAGAMSADGGVVAQDECMTCGAFVCDC